MSLDRVSRRTILKATAAGVLAGGFSNAASSQAAMHVVLLGDSSFDNAPYVASGEEVIEKLRPRLPAGARATLLAVDGAVIADVQRQVKSLPADATHLIVSVGGNDALRESGVLQQPSRSVPESLERLARIRDTFENDYRAMLRTVLGFRLPTAIATIYRARFSEPPLRRIAATALTVLNDYITEEAALRGLPVIDLRTMFSEDADYANAIEPSGRGGEKIANAIAAMLTDHDFGRSRAVLFTG